MNNESQNRSKNKTDYPEPIQMNNQELQFPVTYRLKAVMTAAQNDSENKKRLVDVFNELNIEYLFQGRNKSSKGAYVSFTYEITLNDRQAMNRLYALLKEIENLKFAL